MVSLSSGLSKLTECVGSLEFAKARVFAQLCQVITRNSKLRSLAVSGTKNDPGTLEVHSVTTHQRIAMSFASSCNEFFVTSLGPTSGTSSTFTPMQMSSSVFANTTRIALILNETVFFQLARQVFLPAFRRCSKTQHGLAHFPHHTSAIHQNLRVPTFRWLCTYSCSPAADFSVEESLCV